MNQNLLHQDLNSVSLWQWTPDEDMDFPVSIDVAANQMAFVNPAGNSPMNSSLHTRIPAKGSTSGTSTSFISSLSAPTASTTPKQGKEYRVCCEHGKRRKINLLKEVGNGLFLCKPEDPCKQPDPSTLTPEQQVQMNTAAEVARHKVFMGLAKSLSSNSEPSTPSSALTGSNRVSSSGRPRHMLTTPLAPLKQQVGTESPMQAITSGVSPVVKMPNLPANLLNDQQSPAQRPPLAVGYHRSLYNHPNRPSIQPQLPQQSSLVGTSPAGGYLGSNDVSPVVGIYGSSASPSTKTVDAHSPTSDMRYQNSRLSVNGSGLSGSYKPFMGSSCSGVAGVSNSNSLRPNTQSHSLEYNTFEFMGHQIPAPAAWSGTPIVDIYSSQNSLRPSPQMAYPAVQSSAFPTPLGSEIVANKLGINLPSNLIQNDILPRIDLVEHTAESRTLAANLTTEEKLGNDGGFRVHTLPTSTLGGHQMLVNTNSKKVTRPQRVAIPAPYSPSSNGTSAPSSRLTTPASVQEAVAVVGALAGKKLKKRKVPREGDEPLYICFEHNKLRKESMLERIELPRFESMGEKRQPTEESALSAETDNNKNNNYPTASQIPTVMYICKEEHQCQMLRIYESKDLLQMIARSVLEGATEGGPSLIQGIQLQPKSRAALIAAAAEAASKLNISTQQRTTEEFGSSAASAGDNQADEGRRAQLWRRQLNVMLNVITRAKNKTSPISHPSSLSCSPLTNQAKDDGINSAKEDCTVSSATSKEEGKYPSVTGGGGGSEATVGSGAVLGESLLPMPAGITRHSPKGSPSKFQNRSPLQVGAPLQPSSMYMDPTHLGLPITPSVPKQSAAPGEYVPPAVYYYNPQNTRHGRTHSTPLINSVSHSHQSPETAGVSPATAPGFSSAETLVHPNQANAPRFSGPLPLHPINNPSLPPNEHETHDANLVAALSALLTQLPAQQLRNIFEVATAASTSGGPPIVLGSSSSSFMSPQSSSTPSPNSINANKTKKSGKDKYTQRVTNSSATEIPKTKISTAKAVPTTEKSRSTSASSVALAGSAAHMIASCDLPMPYKSAPNAPLMQQAQTIGMPPKVSNTSSILPNNIPSAAMTTTALPKVGVPLLSPTPTQMPTFYSPMMQQQQHPFGSFVPTGQPHMMQMPPGGAAHPTHHHHHQVPPTMSPAAHQVSFQQQQQSPNDLSASGKNFSRSSISNNSHYGTTLLMNPHSVSTASSNGQVMGELGPYQRQMSSYNSNSVGSNSGVWPFAAQQQQQQPTGSVKTQVTHPSEAPAHVEHFVPQRASPHFPSHQSAFPSPALMYAPQPNNMSMANIFMSSHPRETNQFTPSPVHLGAPQPSISVRHSVLPAPAGMGDIHAIGHAGNTYQSSQAAEFVHPSHLRVPTNSRVAPQVQYYSDANVMQSQAAPQSVANGVGQGVMYSHPQQVMQFVGTQPLTQHATVSGGSYKQVLPPGLQ